jgi:hypothetical protein
MKIQNILICSYKLAFFINKDADDSIKKKRLFFGIKILPFILTKSILAFFLRARRGRHLESSTDLANILVTIVA